MKEDEIIEQLYREMYDKLCIYAMRALNDVSSAEETVQDTFHIACVKKSSLLSSDNPRGWLMNTLKNVIKNKRRSLARLNRLMLSSAFADAAPCDTQSVEMDFRLTYTAILGEEDFALLKRIVLDKYTMLEAAAELGISVDACKKRVRRAKDKLKAALEIKK